MAVSLDCRADGPRKSRFAVRRERTRGQKFAAGGSYGNVHQFGSVGGNWPAFRFQFSQVQLNRLLDVFNGLFARLALADAGWKAWTLRYPIAVFTGINDDLPHSWTSIAIVKYTTGQGNKKLPFGGEFLQQLLAGHEACRTNTPPSRFFYLSTESTSTSNPFNNRERALSLCPKRPTNL